jgi:NADPH:quinone reductase-like Zn-dependent oxidoreductase
MANDKMHAVRTHDYGAANQLKLEEAPRPEPKAGEVLVRLKAAGVNPADWKYRQGLYKAFLPLAFPWTPGIEGAGVVEAVGPGVTTLKPGQAVFGPLNASYAEYAVAQATELAPIPAGLEFDEAAGVPTGALTAWGAVEAAGIKPGQRVLVHGAAGGVGLFASQLAVLKGAHVIGTASAENLDFVKSLGVQQVIDYNAAPFETVVHDVDAVIDTVGGETLERSWQVLRPGGVLVTIAARITEDQLKAHPGLRGQAAGRAPATNLTTIAELIASKKLTPAVQATFPLDLAAAAQELCETGHGRGRIILHIAD